MSPSSERYESLRLFTTAGFDLAPLKSALSAPGYRPFDKTDLGYVDRSLMSLVRLLGENAVVAGLAKCEFAEDEDVLLFSVIAGMPGVALEAAAEATAEAPSAPTLRTLIAGVAENPDGTCEIAEALAATGVSEQTVARIFNRAHSRIHGWRLYFVARHLLHENQLRLAEVADALAAAEPLVFASRADVLATVRESVEKRSLILERTGRMPDAKVRAAWASETPLREFIAAASLQVEAHQDFVGSVRAREIGARLWRCSR